MKRISSARRHGRHLPVLALVMVLTMLLCPVTAAAAADAAPAAQTPSQERRPVTITVVEDIEAVDIEDAEIPLAAMPNSKARTGVKHMAWMSLVLLAVLFYVWYFSRYEKRLFQLRQAAARAEYQAMSRRREAARL